MFRNDQIMRAFVSDIISAFKKDPRVIEQKKLAAMNQWGFAARERFDGDSIAMLPFEVFKGKRDKRRIATLTITSPRLKGKFRIYDYIYFGDFGEKATTILEYYDPKLKLTPFSIRPKSKLASVKEIFITPEMLFATTPEFNERYEIITNDQEAIKLDLNEEFLDEVGDVPGWVYEGNANFLITYQQGKRIPSTSITAEYEHFEQTAERLINGVSSNEFV